MSTFDNSTIREIAIWKTFEFFVPYTEEQAVERDVIYGLYSNSFKNAQGWLQEYSDLELANLLNEFNLKMSGLTTDRKKLVIDITAKRYAIALDTAVHNAELTVKRKKIQLESDTYSAKIAALAADYKSLETLQSKIDAEKKRIAARIQELTAYIETEKADLFLVDVDKAEKNIRLSEKELELVNKSVILAQKEVDLLTVANEIAKVQLQIVEAGIESVNIDLQVSKINTEIAKIENQISKLELIKSELTIEQNRLEIEGLDLYIYDLKKQLAVNKLALIKQEGALSVLELDILSERRDIEENILELLNTELATENKALAVLSVKETILTEQLKIVERQLKLVSDETDIVKLKEVLETTKQGLELLQLAVAQNENVIFDKMIVTANDKLLNEQNETAFTSAAIDDYTTIFASRLATEVLVHSGQLDRISNALERTLLSVEEKNISTELEKQILLLQEGYSRIATVDEFRENAARKDAAVTHISAAIEAANILATASVAATLTHTIGYK